MIWYKSQVILTIVAGIICMIGAILGVEALISIGGIGWLVGMVVIQIINKGK